MGLEAHGRSSSSKAECGQSSTASRSTSAQPAWRILSKADLAASLEIQPEIGLPFAAATAAAAASQHHGAGLLANKGMMGLSRT